MTWLYTTDTVCTITAKYYDLNQSENRKLYRIINFLIESWLLNPEYMRLVKRKTCRSRLVISARRVTLTCECAPLLMCSSAGRRTSSASSVRPPCRGRVTCWRGGWGSGRLGWSPGMSPPSRRNPDNADAHYTVSNIVHLLCMIFENKSLRLTYNTLVEGLSQNWWIYQLLFFALVIFENSTQLKLEIWYRTIPDAVCRMWGRQSTTITRLEKGIEVKVIWHFVM